MMVLLAVLLYAYFPQGVVALHMCRDGEVVPLNYLFHVNSSFAPADRGVCACEQHFAADQSQVPTVWDVIALVQKPLKRPATKAKAARRPAAAAPGPTSGSTLGTASSTPEASPTTPTAAMTSHPVVLGIVTTSANMEGCPVPWRDRALADLRELRERGLGSGGLLRRLRELVTAHGDDQLCRGFRDFYRNLRTITGTEAGYGLCEEELSWAHFVDHHLWDEWMSLGLGTGSAGSGDPMGPPRPLPISGNQQGELQDGSDDALSLTQLSVKVLMIPACLAVPHNTVLAEPPHFLRLVHRRLRGLCEQGRDLNGFIIAFRHLFQLRRDRYFVADCELVLDDFLRYLDRPMRWDMPFEDVDDDLREMAVWIESELWVERIDDVEEATGWESETVLSMRGEPVMPTDIRQAWRRGEELGEETQVASSSSASAAPTNTVGHSVVLNTPGPFVDSMQAYLMYQIPGDLWRNVAMSVETLAGNRCESHFAQFCHEQWVEHTRRLHSQCHVQLESDLEMDEFAVWVEAEMWELYLNALRNRVGFDSRRFILAAGELQLSRRTRMRAETPVTPGDHLGDQAQDDMNQGEHDRMTGPPDVLGTQEGTPRLAPLLRRLSAMFPELGEPGTARPLGEDMTGESIEVMKGQAQQHPHLQGGLVAVRVERKPRDDDEDSIYMQTSMQVGPRQPRCDPLTGAVTFINEGLMAMDAELRLRRACQLRGQLQRAARSAIGWQWRLVSAVLTAAGSPPGFYLPLDEEAAWVRDSMRMLAACSEVWPTTTCLLPEELPVLTVEDSEEPPAQPDAELREREKEEEEQNRRDQQLWEAHQAAVYKDWEDWVVLNTVTSAPPRIRVRVSSTGAASSSDCVVLPTGQPNLPLTLIVTVDRQDPEVTSECMKPAPVESQSEGTEDTVAAYVPGLDVVYGQWKRGEISNEQVTNDHGLDWLDLFMGQRDLEDTLNCPDQEPTYAAVPASHMEIPDGHPAVCDVHEPAGVTPVEPDLDVLPALLAVTSVPETGPGTSETTLDETAERPGELHSEWPSGCRVQPGSCLSAATEGSAEGEQCEPGCGSGMDVLLEVRPPGHLAALDPGPFVAAGDPSGEELLESGFGSEMVTGTPSSVAFASVSAGSATVILEDSGSVFEGSQGEQGEKGVKRKMEE
ncbi:unnamed protein product [Symbiodinium sp. CCMP2592]|nr:unnamed protein product [Symbiodinium sp. CCMP2592]